MTSRIANPFHHFTFAVALGAGLSGCAATPTQDPNHPSQPGQVTRRDIRIVHEDCPVGGADTEKLNVGGDSRPDIVIVKSGGREVCRSVDLNFDGVPDEWIYYDDAGNVRRRESDYDRDGRVDEIAIYKQGVLVEKMRATTLTGKLDTWHFYQNGKLARTERDSDGDAQIDQWWEYPKPDQPECPLIHSDVDGDGLPDPGATVNVCGEDSGYVPPEREAEKAPSGANFDKSSTGDSVPTEVNEKPAPDANGTKK